MTTTDEMPRCETCKHWELLPGPETYHDDTYLPEGEYPLWGWCALVAQPDYGDTAKVSAFTRDASDYRSDLHCRKDFGCVLHEPAAAPDTEGRGRA